MEGELGKENNTVALQKHSEFLRNQLEMVYIDTELSRDDDFNVIRDLVKEARGENTSWFATWAWREARPRVQTRSAFEPVGPLPVIRAERTH